MSIKNFIDILSLFAVDLRREIKLANESFSLAGFSVPLYLRKGLARGDHNNNNNNSMI
jgi:hypothetical protein